MNPMGYMNNYDLEEWQSRLLCGLQVFFNDIAHKLAFFATQTQGLIVADPAPHVPRQFQCFFSYGF